MAETALQKAQRKNKEWMNAHKESVTNEASSLDNENLLRRVFNAYAFYTDMECHNREVAAMDYEILNNELCRRLIKVGFLKE